MILISRDPAILPTSGKSAAKGLSLGYPRINLRSDPLPCGSKCPSGVGLVLFEGQAAGKITTLDSAELPP